MQTSPAAGTGTDDSPSTGRPGRTDRDRSGRRPDPVADLHRRTADLMYPDQRRIRRRLDGLRRVRDPQHRAATVAEVAAEIDAAEQRLRLRQAEAPAVRYPAELPVSERRDEILAAIRDH
ncbi:MAG TPA: hypothetical protein VGD43_06480, partial [Micromonospora sp.]